MIEMTPEEALDEALATNAWLARRVHTLEAQLVAAQAAQYTAQAQASHR